jgi:hypothetical protein
MKLLNPLTFAYNHPNFGQGNIETSLNDVGTDEATLTLDVKAPDGRAGSAQVQMQDNGDVVIRVHRSPQNPIRVLVVGDAGILFEG